jgi:hypothetical protein
MGSLYLMSNPYYHSLSSRKRFGAVPEDCFELHEWFDRGKASQPDYKHRCLSHHAQGIFDATQVFALPLTISTGAKVPVRLISEQHVIEDLGIIPTLQDWMELLQAKRWMSPRARLLFKKCQATETAGTIADSSL